MRRLYCNYRKDFVNWHEQNVMGQNKDIPFAFTPFLTKSPIITDEIAKKLRSMTAKESMIYLGVKSDVTITRYRRALGIKIRVNKGHYTPAELEIIFTNSPARAARVLGRSVQSIYKARSIHRHKGYGIHHPQVPAPTAPKPVAYDPTKIHIFTT